MTVKHRYNLLNIAPPTLDRKSTASGHCDNLVVMETVRGLHLHPFPPTSRDNGSPTMIPEVIAGTPQSPAALDSSNLSSRDSVTSSTSSSLRRSLPETVSCKDGTRTPPVARKPPVLAFSVAAIMAKTSPTTRHDAVDVNRSSPTSASPAAIINHVSPAAPTHQFTVDGILNFRQQHRRCDELRTSSGRKDVLDKDSDVDVVHDDVDDIDDDDDIEDRDDSELDADDDSCLEPVSISRHGGLTSSSHVVTPGVVRHPFLQAVDVACKWPPPHLAATYPWLGTGQFPHPPSTSVCFIITITIA